MSQKIKKISDIVESSVYGNKSYWLSWLYCNGYNVPYAIFLPAVETFEDMGKHGVGAGSLQKFLSPMFVEKNFDVAVRSSATCEDTRDSSLAGHFQTVIGCMTLEEVMHSINQVITSLRMADHPYTCRMGVIIQKRVTSEFSGVAFSSNPVTGEINQCIISAISGMGMALVSGQVKGEDILLSSSNGELRISSYKTGIPQEKLTEIWRIAKDIEARLAYPVDIEWSIEENTGTLYILQCRPATGILREKVFVVHLSIENVSLIPPTVADNKKVYIRLHAEKHRVHVSEAHLVCLNRTKESIQIPSLDTIQPSRFCKGYSVVLIHPETVAGKVVRAFSGLKDLRANVEKVGMTARESQWMSIVIIQEVFDPAYTGIAKKIDDGYVIEIAIGHFIPKGAVATSQYITDTKGTVNYAREVTQKYCLRILDGEVIKTIVPPENSLVSFQANQVRNIVQSFSPFLQNNNVSVEFGILKSAEDNSFYTYLIDLIEEKAGVPPISSQMILEGVLSKGRVTARLVVFRPDPTKSKFDFHFHDELSCDYMTDNPVIFLCESPDISLLEIISKHDPNKIGFIFREASILCHLAIILREKGIPAIQAQNYDKLTPERIVTIDAVTSGLRGEERVIYYA